MAVTQALFYTLDNAQASSQSHSNPGSSVGVHLDHWAVCSGSRGEGVCLPLCHRQCFSGERQQCACVQVRDSMSMHLSVFPLLISTII